MPIETFLDRLFAGDDQQIPSRWQEPLSYRAHYQIHRDENQVQVDADVPGVAKKDLSVNVLNTPQCVVEWSFTRKLLPRQRSPQGTEEAEADEAVPSNTSTLTKRLRLGSSVDCDKLAANLSHGVLRLTAPLKERDESVGPRTIRVTERDD